MEQVEYKLKKFKFKTKYQSNLPLKDSNLKRIVEIVSKDLVCFKIANQVFFENSNNNSPASSIIGRINTLNLFYSRTTKPSNSYQFKKLSEEFTVLFDGSINKTHYHKIRNNYIEYIIMLSKRISGNYSHVFFEPECRYCDRILFHNKNYKNIKIDIVHLHRKFKKIELIECKTTMYHFKMGLLDPSENKHKRKRNYLLGFKEIIENSSDAVTSNFAFATLAMRSEFSVQELNSISPIDILTREDIESTCFIF